MTVIKRDGKKVEFDVKKIERVINLANKSVPPEKRIDAETVTEITNKVVQKIGKRNEVEVEEIQDIVEQNLLQNKKAYLIGKEFLRVRDERAKERFKRLDITKRIKEKLDASNVQNQNANLDEHSFGGRKGEADGELLKQMALDYYISPKFAKNHLENRIYIHDLDSYVVGMHNCLSIPFDYLLKYGFNTRQTDVRPASSINTAFQLVAVIFQLQSLQQFGGVSATHLDWTMVPYVRISFWKHFKELLNAYNTFNEGENFDPIEMPVAREDAMNISIDSKLYKFDKKVYELALSATEKETLQAVEGMYHNLNTLQSRSGCQLPFTSINYGTCTIPEGRMVIRAILEASIDGVGKLHRTSIFPCGIFQKMKGVNDKGSKNYDLYKLALKSTAKRLYPNYANCDWSGNDDTKSYELKNQFIDSLSEEQRNKLINLLKNNKELQDRLGLELVNE
jgi:ribonucleoside-triphosphate reductase